MSGYLTLRAKSYEICSVFVCLLRGWVFRKPGGCGDFDGTYEFRKCNSKKEFYCVSFYFELVQKGERIYGEHSGSTAGLGRLNEGGPVRGIAVGKVALLTVKSGRNDEIVLGKATIAGNNLSWTVVETISEGNPSVDALIFNRGILKKTSAAKRFCQPNLQF